MDTFLLLFILTKNGKDVMRDKLAVTDISLGRYCPLG
jgi:hypothetical protein